MLALAGAVVFALALILDWADATVSDAFTPQTLLFLGLLLVALHLGGIGTSGSVGSWRGRGRARR
ncbi:MAG TPA: hypothetical protein VLM05_07030 [Mycobacteriales bacterium]|nr:hypothetical protein [Mycobacteriales bacterium]